MHMSHVGFLCQNFAIFHWEVVELFNHKVRVLNLTLSLFLKESASLRRSFYNLSSFIILFIKYFSKDSRNEPDRDWTYCNTLSYI